jgi:hypothetical protein
MSAATQMPGRAVARNPALPPPAPVHVQTLSGRMVDLMAPRASDVDFAGDIAPGLACLPRFAGRTKGHVPFMVAQHCIWAHDWLAGECGASRAFRQEFRLMRGEELRLAQAAWLLHDAHEAWIGDVITPFVSAVAGHARAEFGEKPGYRGDFIVKCGVASLKAACDRAIHEAAGLPWPLPDHIAAAVKRLDARATITEKRHLMPHERHWGALENLDSLPMKGALKPERSRELLIVGWLARLDAHCPDARRRESAAALQALAGINRTRTAS